MGRNIGKNVSKNLSGEDSQKRFYHAKQSTTNALKTASKREIQKTTEAVFCISNSISNNKISDTITKVSKTSPQNSSETVTNREKNA